MSLSKLPIVRNYDLNKFEKCIYPQYKFSCTKWWKDKNKCIIFKADRDKVEEIYETYDIQDINILAELASDLIGPYIDRKAIISGGHTIINLADRYSVGKEAILSTEFTFKIIEAIYNKFNKKLEFMVQLNDLYMEQDMDITTGHANKYRDAALKPYIIPTQINDILIKYSEKLDKEFQYYYCAEKNMADRFKRFIKSKKKKDSKIFKNRIIGEDNYWNIVVDNQEITALLNNKPNCVAANAGMLRAIRYNIDNNKIKDNFKSYIGVFPLCSIDNVLNGYKVANLVYDLDLPSYYIFYGKSCF